MSWWRSWRLKILLFIWSLEDFVKWSMYVAELQNACFWHIFSFFFVYAFNRKEPAVLSIISIEEVACTTSILKSRRLGVDVQSMYEELFRIFIILNNKFWDATPYSFVRFYYNDAMLLCLKCYGFHSCTLSYYKICIQKPHMVLHLMHSSKSRFCSHPKNKK